MSSVSSTHLIMFIGSLLIATAVAGTVVVEIGGMSDSIETRGSAVAEDIETELVIISDESQPDSIVDEDGNVTVLVKNIGTTVIPGDPGQFDVLVDGSYTAPADVQRVDGAQSDWEPGGVVELTIDPDRDLSGDTEIVVIVGSNEDSITTYVDGDGDGDGDE